MTFTQTMGLLSTSIGSVFRPLSKLEPKGRATWLYTGVKLVDGFRAVEVRSAMTLPRATYQVKAPDELEQGRFTLSGMDMEYTGYFDAGRGFAIADYTIIMMAGEVAGERFAQRTISLTRLDRRSSSCI